MELINETPFPSITFQAQDRHGKSSHVVVLRATLDIAPDGTLEISSEQEPIVLTDEYFGERNRSSVRQESDLVPCKPKCDVIVNATAHAPGGKPYLGFAVGVRITGPPREKGDPGPPILEKKLVVTGPRYWEKGLGGGWTLKPPTTPFTSLPLRYENAFGGECRVEREDPDARRVEEAYRLTPEERALHPDGPDSAPVAHTVCGGNPIGTGFVEEWYLKARRITTLPAPRIDSPDNPVSVLCANYPPQGFGIVAKAWKQRLGLAGTYDSGWREKRWPCLPEDFDPAFWNGANPDLQTPYLTGDEMVTLTNLTPGGALRLRLPGLLPSFEISYDDGRKSHVSPNLDTLIIETDRMKVSMVWRAVFPVLPDKTAIDARVSLKGSGR
jgi:hypothetical protein